MQNELQYSAEWNSCIFDPTEEMVTLDTTTLKRLARIATEKGLHQMPKNNCTGTPYDRSSNLRSIHKALGPHYDRIHAFAHHLYKNNAYRNPDTLNADFNYIAEYTNNFSFKPIFQTEYGKSNSDTAIDRKLNLAKLMHNALTLEKSLHIFIGG